MQNGEHQIGVTKEKVIIMIFKRQLKRHSQGPPNYKNKWHSGQTISKIVVARIEEGMTSILFS